MGVLKICSNIVQRREQWGAIMFDDENNSGECPFRAQDSEDNEKRMVRDSPRMIIKKTRQAILVCILSVNL